MVFNGASRSVKNNTLVYENITSFGARNQRPDLSQQSNKLFHLYDTSLMLDKSPDDLIAAATAIEMAFYF